MDDSCKIKIIPDENQEKLIRAFQTAYDIRKFEIDLYWKRAAYFWAFIAITFTGYFAALKTVVEYNDIVLFCLNSMGIVFSWTWVLVLKGSKYWQENWEKLVSEKEEKVQGVVFDKIKFIEKKERGFLEASPFSVSKLNILLSVYILFIWLILFIYPTNKGLIKIVWERSNIHFSISELKEIIIPIIMSAITIITMLIIFFCGKSSFYESVTKTDKNKKNKPFFNPKNKEYTD